MRDVVNVVFVGGFSGKVCYFNKKYWNCPKGLSDNAGQPGSEEVFVNVLLKKKISCRKNDIIELSELCCGLG